MRQAGILLAASPLAKIPSRAKPARELAASPQKVSRSHPLPPATQASPLVIKLVWYTLKQLFSSVSVKVVDIYLAASGSVNIHHHSPPLL